MRKIIAGIGLGLLTLCTVYGLGAFIAWNTNPGSWPTEGRAIIGFLAFPLAALVASGLWVFE